MGWDVMAIVNSVPHVLSGCKEGQTGGGDI